MRRELFKHQLKPKVIKEYLALTNGYTQCGSDVHSLKPDLKYPYKDFYDNKVQAVSHCGSFEKRYGKSLYNGFVISK